MHNDALDRLFAKVFGCCKNINVLFSQSKKVTHGVWNAQESAFLKIKFRAGVSIHHTIEHLLLQPYM